MFDIVKKLVMPRIGGMQLGLQKRSPEILLVTGLVAGVGAVILIAKAHKKSDYIVANYRMGKEDVEFEIVDDEEESGEQLSETERRKRLLPVHTRLVLDIVKSYGPGIALGVSSVGFILASHNIQSNRIQALGAALAIVQGGFATYRARVQEELGTEADERFYYGAESRKVAIVEEQDDGKLKKRRVNKNYLPEDFDPSMYGRVFEQGNERWDPDPEMAEFILRASQTHMNDLLHIKGHVFLAEVYKDLGFEVTNYSRAVGWSRLKPGGDGIVLYGLDDDINQRGENRWALDFNVQGYILDDSE